MNEIESALETIKRVSSLAYGRYALAGEEEPAKVAGLELCEAMTTAAGGT